MWHFPKHSWICALFKQLQCYRHNSDPKFDRLWNLRYTFDMLSDVHAKFYSVSGRLTVGKVTVVFKEKIISNGVHVNLRSTKFLEKRFTRCVTWVGEGMNGCALREGQDICNRRNDSYQSYCTQNWRDMDKNYVLTFFVCNLFNNMIKMQKEDLL